MRKYLSYILLLILACTILCGFSFPKDMSSNCYVYDEGDFLTAAEEAQIQAAIESVNTKADILVVFTDRPESADERACAENIAKAWRDAGYATKKNRETVVFYVDMANRRFFTNEYNDKEKWLVSDEEIDSITYAVRSDMSAGRYGSAALTAVEYIGEYAKPGFFQTVWAWLMSGAFGGGLATLIGVGSHNKSSKVARRYYLKDQEVQILASNEFYTGSTQRTIDHTPQERQDSGPGGGGGGFTPSSGGSSGNHGGGASF